MITSGTTTEKRLKMPKTLESLKESGEAPPWYTQESLSTVSRGYLLEGETPRQMYKRVASGAAATLNRPDLESRFFDAIWANWLCPASPILSNLNTSRGLPISCNSIHVQDSLDNILQKGHELGILSKHGAGVGIYAGDLRARGSAIKGTGGRSDGVIAWSKIYDSIIHSTSQGATRRGAAAVFLEAEHGDIDEFLNMRRAVGDLNKRCLNLNHGVIFSDDFMNRAIAGDKHAEKVWTDALDMRMTTGEPYMLFSDNVNNHLPDAFKQQKLKISTSNICCEILIPTDKDHTFVCCLSSLNLMRWDEWKDTDVVELAVYFLDAVLSEYITKAKNIRGLESAVRSAEKTRAIGIGVLGWHSLLQSKGHPFDSFDSMILNAQIFKKIDQDSRAASSAMAITHGEPEYCRGLGIRHSVRMAVAPTVSNSTISGVDSAGIEPISANIFVKKTAKGTFVVKNRQLEALLASKNKDTDEVWGQISKDAGSVQGLKFLTTEEKKVFLKAVEINQFSLVKQAAQRQKWIDQSQSLNLFFSSNVSPDYFHEVHMEAWQSGVKTLYYCRSESVLRADLASRSKGECEACSG